MAIAEKDNNFIFDKVDRSYKRDTILAIAYAIKNLAKDNGNLENNLKVYFDLIKPNGSGAYQGTKNQFLSFYTPALDFGVIKKTSPCYELSELAKVMVEGDISSKDYISIVILNYIQVMKSKENKMVNLLLEILKIIKDISSYELSENDVLGKEYFEQSEYVKIAFKLLGSTHFFSMTTVKRGELKLKYNTNYEIDMLIKICEESLEKAEKITVESLREQEIYSEFLTYDYLNIKKNRMSLNFDNITKEQINNSIQKIVYGAPGTGKSYFLSKEANEKFNQSNIERVTFYDGYSYGQFVGMYKPASDDENNIIYKYVPGPLMRILVKALTNTKENYCLIIEEINRAKADKVFGNIFQLLDRNSDGESRYKISVSEEQESYLTEKGINVENGLYLPKNLYIWATMNSADEGVQPLDTAFKRRWKFKYMSLNEKEEEFLKSKEEKELVAFKIGAENISWNKFRKVLNSILSSNHITEDKLLAPFFISPSDFEEDIENIEILNQDVFIEKVLMYIYDDLLRHYPKAKKEIFSEEIKTFSDIYEKSKDSNFEDIFNDSFKEKINS